MASSRAARRSSGVARCAIVLLLTLLVTSCSDAYTEEEKARAEVGGSSQYTLITAAPSVAPLMEQLASAYMLENPTVRLVVVPQAEMSVEDLADIRPAVWVGDASESLAGTEQLAAPEVALGSDALVTITPTGNPGGIDDLAVFGAEEGLARTALCDEEVLCGSSAREALRERGIDPSPGRVTPDAATLRTAVGNGNMLAGIVYRTDLAPTNGDVDVLPELLGDDAGRIDYSLLAFSSSDEVRDFAEWVTTSTTARDMVASAGLLPPPAA